MPEWNEDAFELARRWVGRPESSVVGCQSIGFMRSSNEDDAENFHFLMIVQMMAEPATEAPMTMRMVTVVRVTLESDVV